MKKKYSGKRGVYSLLVGMLVFSLIFSTWLVPPVQAATLSLSEAQAANKKISGGFRHSLAVNSEGRVVAWGSNQWGQCNVPADLHDAVAVSAGTAHSLALTREGKVVAWGWNDVQQCSINGLTDIVAIAAGTSFSLALKRDGIVVACGSNIGGKCDINGETQVVAISAGLHHSLALKSDGTVVAKGSNSHGQCNINGLTDVVAISARGFNSLALKRDGAVVAYGYNKFGQCNVPIGLQDVVDIAAGDHSLALQKDGKVVAWGNDQEGQCRNINGQTGVAGIATGDFHSLALKSDGTVIAMGSNTYGQCNIPSGLDLLGKLSSLQLSTGSLSPAFAPEHTNYIVEVPNSVNKLDITAEMAVPSTFYKLEITGNTFLRPVYPVDGQPQTVMLVPGWNNVDVAVVEKSTGLTRTYKIFIERKRDTEPLTIIDINPKGSDVPRSASSIQLDFNKTVDNPKSKEITISVSEAVYSADVRSASCWGNTAVLPFTAFKDRDNDVLSLAYASEYSVTVPEGAFQHFRGGLPPMYSLADHWTFTTEEEPLVPTASPPSLTIDKGKTSAFTVALGQGSAAATSAKIRVSNEKVATVDRTTVNTPGTITVTALAVGNSDITIEFDDPAKTVETVRVEVQAVPPVWPADSSFTAGETSSTASTLNWTAAQDLWGVTGYKLFQDGAELDTVTGNVYSYDVTGLSPSSTYLFQVQAGNTDDAWTTDGPQVMITTKVKPLNPTVSPPNLTISKGKTAAFSLEFGQGSSGATSADISVGDERIAMVDRTTVNVPGKITVTGLAVGTTDITVEFDDLAKTVETVSVEVQVVSPAWPADSSLTASGTTSTATTLNWTAAQDNGGVTSYKLFQDGTEVATVTGDVYSYNITGLTPSSTYTFQVQAGNTDGVWTIDGPTATVTTTSSDDSSGSSEKSQSSSSVKAILTAGTYQQKLKVNINKASSTASTRVNADILNQGFENSLASNDGVRKVKIEIPKVSGLDSYMLELSAVNLSSALGDRSIEMVSEAGTVIIPSNMLAGLELENTENISISISKVDKSKLSQDLRDKIDNKPVIELKLTAGDKKIEWNNSAAPVMVSIPYTPTAEELANPQHIVIWYIDGNGNIVSVPSGRYDPVTGTVSFTTTHFSYYAVAYVHKTFNDLESAIWAKKTIEVMASKGIINGTGVHNYSPLAHITRADYLVMLVKTLGLTADFHSNFADVSRDAYYYEACGIARKLGIAAGSGDNLFKPAENISRQDMVALTANALRKFRGLEVTSDLTVLNKFSDKGDIAGYAANCLATMVKEGLISGSDNKLNPRADTTRAEAAAFLYRIYNKVKLH